MARGFNPTGLIPPRMILERVDETGTAVVLTGTLLHGLADG